MNEYQDSYEALKLKNQLCFPLYVCSKEIVRGYTPYLKPVGLTYTQYITMMVLWEEQRITVGELGHRLYLDSGTLTPLLRKLETAGYLVRERSEEDERVVEIRVTEEGMALREQVKDIPHRLGRNIMCGAGLTDEEVSQLYTLLYKVIKGTGEGDRNDASE